MTVRNRRKELRRHFDRRSGERLGFLLTNGDQHDMVKQIQCGRAIFVRRTSNTRTVWRIQVGGIEQTVVYDKRHKAVVTVW